MKNKSCLLLTLAASLSLVVAGCEGIDGVPYQHGTAAARIHEGQPHRSGAAASTETSSGTNTMLIVPVIAGDSESGRYLDFSSVRVDMKEDNGKKLLTAYTTVNPRLLLWRVGLIKDGKEYSHFTAATKHHYFGEAISLEPLALDPDLAVPDRIVVTPLFQNIP